MRFIRSVCLLAALACTGAALAAQNRTPARDAFYRCKGANGQTYYGDSKPAACQGQDTEVLNDRGMVMRVIEGTQSRIAREQREVGESRARKEREAREQHDRMLIETFLTVEDIERLRDQRLELLDSKYRVTEQNISNLRDRQARLQSQIARFKPYSDKENAPPLPDHLAEEMVNTVNGMQVYAQTLAQTRAEQAEIKATFGADIARFKELKGIK
ncbi:MAG TPA: hypothetical protein VNQ81_14445 [Povalibacter sp.]|nr:hypothetical protein [Povalibacter sp.]